MSRRVRKARAVLLAACLAGAGVGIYEATQIGGASHATAAPQPTSTTTTTPPVVTPATTAPASTTTSTSTTTTSIPALPARITYTIQPGDTLTSIAAKFALKGWGSIFRENWVEITNPNDIYPGWVITITDGTTMTLTPPTGNAS